jgi:putative transposase
MGKYELVFKKNAVRLSYERGEIKNLALELGISRFTLLKWRKKFDYLKLILRML